SIARWSASFAAWCTANRFPPPTATTPSRTPSSSRTGAGTSSTTPRACAPGSRASPCAPAGTTSAPTAATGSGWRRRTPPPTISPDSDDRVVDQQLARAEDLQWLDQAVDRLDDKRKQALVLSRIEGRTAAEVSRMTGISPNTVASRVRAALRKLRGDLLARNG